MVYKLSQTKILNKGQLNGYFINVLFVVIDLCDCKLWSSYWFRRM